MQKTIQESKLHDHTCMIFKTQLEFFHCAIPFIREGIKNNEKCLIVIDEILKEEVLKNFRFLFREKDSLHKSEIGKNIVIEQFRNIYLPDGSFDMERTGDWYIQFVNKSLQEGYNGLRVFAEVGPLMKNLITEDPFLIWEISASKFFPSNKLLAVCAYNKKYFSEDFVTQVIKAHPIKIDVLKTRF